jgi:hypothetical protein
VTEALELALRLPVRRRIGVMQAPDPNDGNEHDTDRHAGNREHEPYRSSDKWQHGSDQITLDQLPQSRKKERHQRGYAVALFGEPRGHHPARDRA